MFLKYLTSFENPWYKIKKTFSIFTEIGIRETKLARYPARAGY